MLPLEPRVFTAGREERVACLPPQGLPEPRVWWEHAGVRLPTHGRVFQQGHELVFAGTAESDAGVYTCHAANLAGQRRQDVNITVASEHLCPEGRGEVEGSPGPTARPGLWVRCAEAWCLPEALSALGCAHLGLSQLLGGDVGVDCEEPGTEVGVTAHTEKQPSGCRARARDRDSRDPGPTLSLVHGVTICSKPPALPGLGFLIHKMELITYYLPYKIVRKIKCACSQLGGRLVAGHSLVASFACLKVDGGWLCRGASGVSPMAAEAGQLRPPHTVVEATSLLKPSTQQLPGLTSTGFCVGPGQSWATQTLGRREVDCLLMGKVAATQCKETRDGRTIYDHLCKQSATPHQTGSPCRVLSRRVTVSKDHSPLF